MNNIASYKEYCILNHAIYDNLTIQLYNAMYSNLQLFYKFLYNGIQPHYYHLFIECLYKVFYRIMGNNIEWTYNQARKIILTSLPIMNRTIKQHITLFNMKELIQLVVISIKYNLSNDHTIIEKLAEKFFHKDLK